MLLKTQKFFGPNSPMQRAAELGGRPYEERPQQREMAETVATNLDNGRHLCIEAPTGVGKTFAYLVPAIHYAIKLDKPVIVSTHTISLQEQILEKDIPLLQKMMGIDFHATVAKGRSNYLCRRRLASVANMDQAMLPGAVLSDLEKISEWAWETKIGCRSDLGFVPAPGIWEGVCCERGNCLNAKCPYYKQCFMQKARRSLTNSQIIVANHALFFSDLAMKLEAKDDKGGVLPAYCAVIMDEGHTIEECASSHLGIRVSSSGILRGLARLYNARGDRGLLKGGNRFADARDAVNSAGKHAVSFFNRVAEWLDPQEIPLRYTTPGHIPPLLDEPLKEVEGALAAFDDPEDKKDEQIQEIVAMANQIHSQRVGMFNFLQMNKPGYVYWFEREGRDKKDVVLNAVPISIASVLEKALFQRGVPVVITSATLAVRGSMDYFNERIGVRDVDNKVLDSPFNFQQQVTVHIPYDMPSPKQTNVYHSAAANHIRHFIRETHGKAFVLFTSYRMMREMADELEEFFSDEGIELMVQGQGLSRTRMLQAFRDDVDSVLFGTASFWTGVDVPGESLSNVIITRLPFAVPDHPLTAARMEAIERSGANPFWDYTVPEAILRFRQGFGRLIRSRKDKGIVVILDNRVVRTKYGKAFLESIPTCNMNVFKDA